MCSVLSDSPSLPLSEELAAIRWTGNVRPVGPDVGRQPIEAAALAQRVRLAPGPQTPGDQVDQGDQPPAPDEEPDLVLSTAELTGLEPGEVRLDLGCGDGARNAAVGYCDGAGRLLEIRQIGIRPGEAAAFVRSYNGVPDPERAVAYRVVSVRAVLELAGGSDSDRPPRRVVAVFRDPQPAGAAEAGDRKVSSLREHHVRMLSNRAVYVFSRLAAGESIGRVAEATGLGRWSIAAALRWLRKHHDVQLWDLRHWHRVATHRGQPFDLRAIAAAPVHTRAAFSATTEESLAMTRMQIAADPDDVFAPVAEEFLLAKLRRMDGCE